MEDSLTSKISNWGTWVGSKGADVFTDWDFLGGHSTKFYEFVGAEANNFINFLLDARHLWALGWGVAMVIFGLFILAWDTRPSYT